MSGLVVDVWGNDAADGADGVLWENLSGGNQLFSTLMDNGSQLNPFKNFEKKPQYKIINKLSGKVADLAAGGSADGTNIQQWDYNGTSAQKWADNKLENGYFWLEPEAAPGKSLQLDGFSSSNGENITLWSYDGNKNKKWSVLAVPGETYFKLE